MVKPERITIGPVEVGGIYGDDREGFSIIRKMFKKNYKKGGKVSNEKGTITTDNFFKTLRQNF